MSITVDNKKRVQTYKPQATSNTEKTGTSVTVPVISAKSSSTVDVLYISKPKTAQSKTVKPKTTKQAPEKYNWLDTACDVVGDVGAGVAGTTLGPIFGTIAGAGLKVGVGYIKAKAQNKKYTSKNLKDDLFSGAINGLIGAVTFGVGGFVAKHATKKLAKWAIKHTTTIFFAKEIFTGAAFGAGNEISRQQKAGKGFNTKSITKSAFCGAMLGPVMAKGFNKLGEKILKPLSEKVVKSVGSLVSHRSAGNTTSKVATEVLADTTSISKPTLGELTISKDKVDLKATSGTGTSRKPYTPPNIKHITITPKNDICIGARTTNNKAPRYLYHFTNEENYKKMFSEGTIKVSEDGCGANIHGVYLVDIQNFAKSWSRLYDNLFGENFQTALIGQVAKSGKRIYCMKIPVRKLNGKIYIRSQNKLFKAMNENNDTSKDLLENISSYKLYQRRNEAIEYIHTENINIDDVEIVGSCELPNIISEFNAAMNRGEILSHKNVDNATLELLRKLFNGRPESNAFIK